MATFAFEVALAACNYHEKAGGPPEWMHLEYLAWVLFNLLFFVTQVVEDMEVTEALVAIGVMVEVTDPMVEEREAMVEEREAMVEVTDPTAVVVVVDTPTGVVDTPVAAAVVTGIIGEGFLKHRIILHKEPFYNYCNREHFKYGKYYFWF